MSPQEIQAVAAVATFFAAALAVWATLRAPRLAAEFAERLRFDAQRDSERRNQKLFIFANLMQYRAQILNPNAVGSLNLIDVVFVDCPEVRLAWRHFHEATMSGADFSSERVRERYLAIIEKIARNLGLSEAITISDIQSSYYPRGLGEVDEAAFLEVQDKLKRFRGPESRG